MIELMIDQNGGLDSDYNQVIRLANPMHVCVLNPPICHSQSSFVVGHCTFRPTCSVLVEPIYVVGGTEYVLLPCVIICVPHNIPGGVFGVCCTCAVLYYCWVPVFEGT